MRRTLIVALTLGLLAGSIAAPVEAAKKKKKKPPVVAPVATPVTLWFRNDTGGCAPEAYLLMLTEATEGANCGNRLYGAPYGVASGAGLITPITYNASEGIPFVLDATQKITATIYVSPSASANPVGSGIGQATLVATIAGQAGGEAKELGTVEQDYLVTPAQATYEVKLEFTPPADVDKLQFTSFSITLHNEGLSLTHGHYRTANPASFLTIPTWK